MFHIVYCITALSGLSEFLHQCITIRDGVIGIGFQLSGCIGPLFLLREVCQHCLAQPGAMHLRMFTHDRSHKVNGCLRISRSHIENFLFMRDRKIDSLTCHICKFL